ncbi:MAG: CBS domain-containing protein [Gammaproteobacteria bacterium]|jgi:Mg/Co/Ni transporter MgtE
MHNELVHQFLKKHPQECAREMENFSLDDILLFIQQLNKKEAGLMMSSLMPSMAAVCFQNLPIDQSKEIIKHLPLNTLKKVLPRIHEELRESFIEMLPKNQKIALQHALSFASNSVGAYMNTRVLFLPIEHTVGQAVNLIKDFSDEIDSLIFCIDNQTELQGMVYLKDIMLAPHEQAVSHLMQDCPLVLLTSMNIQTIALNEIWQHQSIVPVTDEHNILLGILEYSKVVNEIQQLLFNDRKENIADSLAHIMFMFSHAAENILNELSELSTGADHHDHH